MKRNVFDIYTEFIFREDIPEKSDIIFVPGSEEGALAVRAAELWRAGLAPVILPSGKYAKLTGHLKEHEEYASEWEYLKAGLMEQGVPERAIWKEDQATFTYENAIYSRKVTDAAGLSVKTALVCCQAYHARRAKLYYEVCFPEARILMIPTVTKGVSRENWYKREASIDLVLKEVEHCGSQFHDIFLEHLQR